jgi:hypothetical protein
MVHENVGHLGIFVSGKVARKEHRGIIGCIDMLEYLSPGLYEMIVEGEPSQTWLDDYHVRFEPRTMEDILELDDGLEDEEAFPPVNVISRFNDGMYNMFVSPWVRAFVTDSVAETIRQLHPLRIERYMFSDLNPFIQPIKMWAEALKPHRLPVSADNPFLAMETVFSEAVQTGLNYYRAMRDLTQEFCFKSIYGNPWMKWLLGAVDTVVEDKLEAKRIDKQTSRRRKAWTLMAATEGGFAEAVVRIFIAVAGANRILDKRQFEAAEKIIRASERLNRLSADHYKVMIKEQARVLELNKKLALEGLAKLLPTQNERIAAYKIAEQIASADTKADKHEKAMLHRLKGILDLDEAG